MKYFPEAETDSDGKIVVCGAKSCPLLTTKQLLNWRNFIGNDRKYVVCHKITNMSTKKNEHEVLLCHDMKGGYLEDSFNDGHSNLESYRFYNWSLINIFVYFSHNLVTIPPLGWINAAHRNGASCFGTFLVEDWSKIQTDEGDTPVSGRDMLLEILKDTETVKLYADRLIKIAQYFHFDGWLVNIEVNLPEEKVQLLLEFIQILTKGMHQMLSNDADAAVIWYDSVTLSGKIEYQNALTIKNYKFFDSCDGIFLNYWWQPEMLRRSADFAMDACDNNSRYRIYAGIDVHGRNTFGGGKWNSNAALRSIQEQQVSTALFAPAWTFENFCSTPDFCFEDYEHRFWSLLFPFLINSERVITNLPIETTFSTGYSYQRQFDCESRFIERPWFNLSEMELQPSFCLNRRISFNNLYQCKPTLECNTEHGEQFTLFRTNIELSTKQRYEITAAYDCQKCLSQFILLNDEYLDCFIPEIKILEIQTEYCLPGNWKKEKIIFEFISNDSEERFILKNISVFLTFEDRFCYIGLFRFQQISKD